MKLVMKKFYVLCLFFIILLVNLNGAEATKSNANANANTSVKTDSKSVSANSLGDSATKKDLNKANPTESSQKPETATKEVASGSANKQQATATNTTNMSNSANVSKVNSNVVDPKESNSKTGAKPIEDKASPDKNNPSLKTDKPQVEIGGKAKPDENLNGYQGYQVPLGSILDITLSNTGGVYTLIFLVSRDFVADVKVLNYPFRLLIDIPMPFDWKADSNKIRNNIPVTLISGFRYGNPAKNVFRVVVDLNRSIAISGSYLRKRTDGNYDFVLNVSLDNVTNSVFANSTVVYGDTNTIKDINKISETYDSVEKDKRNKLRQYNQVADYLALVTYKKPTLSHSDRKAIVFLDPGHGGKDPGAINSTGALIEKNVVLELALKVKERLESNPEIAVVMSRDGDYYVPLGDRVMWAQNFNSSIFVSMHADISSNMEKSSGMSVYTLSDIASDAQAQMLANNANRSDIIAGIMSSEYDEEVNKILISLSQRVKVNESIVLARGVLASSGQKVKILPSPLRSAGFAVLKVPNVPSVLIELGFLSNPADVANFQSESYKKDMSESIAIGIESYLWEKGLLKQRPNAVITSEESKAVVDSNVQEVNNPKEEAIQ